MISDAIPEIPARSDRRVTAGQGDVRLLAGVAALAGLAALALFQMLAAQLAGVFEYPLDDPYIHLSMAEGIARGGYGINAGEYASAASSILWPFLLVPLATVEAGRYLPLVLNTLAMVGVCLCWGWAVARLALPRPRAILMAILGPLVLNVAGVAALGMEHSLHALLTVLLVLGLAVFLDSGRLRWWFGLVIVAAPLVRFEGLALSLMACAVLMLRGRPRAGVGLAVLAVAGVAAFMITLHAMGLPLLPASVLAKSSIKGHGGAGLDHLLAMLARNLNEQPGGLVLVLSVVMLILPLTMPALRRDGRFWLPVILGVAGLAHMAFGRIGWGARYENYLVTGQAVGLLVCWGWAGMATLRGQIAGGVALLLTLGIGVSWAKTVSGFEIASPRAVLLQQAQMARFQRDYWQGAVAANDIGLLSWRNPDYVLDLWGLGSAEALARRLDPDRGQGWAADLVRVHGAGLAMIYDHWLGDAVAPGWRRLGSLDLATGPAITSGTSVAFYATTPEAAQALVPELHAFAATLPEGATFTFDPSPAP